MEYEIDEVLLRLLTYWTLCLAKLDAVDLLRKNLNATRGAVILITNASKELPIFDFQNFIWHFLKK